MIATLAPILAGLGLFFCGIHFFAKNLVGLLGRRMRRLLMRASEGSASAALVGIAAGGLTQSASAVSSVVIGLVAGGAIKRRGAILVPTWAHVGASLLVIMVAIDLRLGASLAIALAGFAIYFGLDESDSARGSIGMLLGLGLLFLGIDMMKSAADPVRDLLAAEGLLQVLAGSPWVALAAGIGLTFVCQTSIVAAAVTVAAVRVGLIDVPAGLWMVLGANVGSALNHLLAARSTQGEPRQIALAQAAQKAFGSFALAAGLALSAGVAGTVALPGVPDASRLALVFLAMQIVGALGCTLAFGPLAALLERIAPPTPEQALSKPAFLSPEALVEPSGAISLVLREEQRVLGYLPRMLDGVRADAVPGQPPPGTLRAAGIAVTDAMTRYLEALLRSGLEAQRLGEVIALQHRVAQIASLLESVDEFVTAVTAARAVPASGRVADQMVEASHLLLCGLADAAGSDDPEDRRVVLPLLGSRDELMDKIRRRVLQEDPAMPQAAQEALLATTLLFERIVWLARRSTLLLGRSGDEALCADAA